MKVQQYENHKQYYPAHHFVFYPVILALLGTAIWFGVNREDERPIWFFLAALVAVTGWLSFMLRQHYAVTLQNRIVLMELRYRYFSITQQQFEPLEAALSKGQLFALRFASDEELPALAERALKERLTGTEIKKAIVNWRADWMRV